MSGRRGSLNSQADGCPPLHGAPQRQVRQALKRKAEPSNQRDSSQCKRRKIVTPPAVCNSDFASLTDRMQRLTVDAQGTSVKPGPVHLPGSSPQSQADGCPPLHGMPQRRVPQAPKRKVLPRRRRKRLQRRNGNKVTRPAARNSDLDSLIKPMQRLTIGPPGRSVKPGPVCLPWNRPSSQADGCPALHGTPQRQAPQASKRKAPLRNQQDSSQCKRRKTVTPPAVRNSDRASLTDSMQRSTVDAQGTSVKPGPVHFPGAAPKARQMAAHHYMGRHRGRYHKRQRGRYFQGGGRGYRGGTAIKSHVLL